MSIDAYICRHTSPVSLSTLILQNWVIICSLFYLEQWARDWIFSPFLSQNAENEAVWSDSQLPGRKLLNNKDKNLGYFHTERARQGMYIHGSFSFKHMSPRHSSQNWTFLCAFKERNLTQVKCSLQGVFAFQRSFSGVLNVLQFCVFFFPGQSLQSFRRLTCIKQRLFTTKVKMLSFQL